MLNLSQASRKLWRLISAMTALNLLVFAVYRVVFLHRFHPDHSLPLAGVVPVLLSGFRLDLALIGFELFCLGVLAICLGRVYLRGLFLALLALTYAHVVAVFANFLLFRERNLELGEMLLAYIGDLQGMSIAVGAFLLANPLLMAGFLLTSGLGLYTALRLGRRWRGQSVDLWRPKRNLLWALVSTGLAITLCIEPVIVKRTVARAGWELKFTHSKYYTKLNDFYLNEAVVNPAHELFRVHIPAAFKPTLPFRLETAEALGVTQSLLGVEQTDSTYPLLRHVHSDLNLGLENVVLIQVEGLSQSMIGHRFAGRLVMPFLSRLADEGLYFPNTLQGFNGTAGAVFSAATGLHKACFDERGRRFASYELKAPCGALPDILGSRDYRHIFALAFRQNQDEFMSFMGNQGYQCFGYPDFSRSLAQKGLSRYAEDDQGVVDGFFLPEAADVLLRVPGRFTAHLVTITSHSPWRTPADFRSPFPDPMLATFAYVDHALEEFVEAFRRRPDVFQKTLFVVVADHASVTFTTDLLERLRIPLIFYNPKLAALRSRWVSQYDAWACHADILPTILYLLGGDHPYSGVGACLLTADPRRKGAISGSPQFGLYVKEDFALQYLPFRHESKLFALRGRRIDLQDLAAERPQTLQQMLREYLALYETSKRLLVTRRLFPARGFEKR
jgi:hypothetical protein